MITRYRSVVSADHVEAALRTIWQDLMRRGMLPDEVDNYRRSSEWFPWLKTHPAIEQLRESLNHRFGRGLFCSLPQIVFQPPDTYAAELHPHVDRDQQGETFASIAGLALTAQTQRSGGLVWWDHDGNIRAAPPAEPGDVLVMDGETPHASGPNKSAMPRIAVYFREEGHSSTDSIANRPQAEPRSPMSWSAHRL